MAVDNTDPEKGLASAMTRPVVSSWAPPAPNSTNNIDSSKHTSLQLFQVLVGISTPQSLTGDGTIDGQRTTEAKPKRAKSGNVGLYQRAKQQERTSRIAYHCTSYISNTLYLLQILLAASFTALSSYKETLPVTLTVLGTANTVLAGCLAWQKGQGVPQRYRKAQDQYQALILEIEMTERSFVDVENNNSGADSVKLDPRKEQARLQKLYDTARADQQANYPDLYVSTGATAAQDARDLTKQLNDAKAEAAKVQSNLLAKIEMLVGKLEDKVVAHVEATIQGVAKV